MLRTAALPAAGVPAVAASAQIAALLTAVGGVLLKGDPLSLVSLVCTGFAAVLGATAVIAATRWRLARHPEFSAPLEHDDVIHAHPGDRIE